MCRFSGPDDTEYKKVAAALHPMTTDITKGHAPPYSSLLTDEQGKKLGAALNFSRSTPAS